MSKKYEIIIDDAQRIALGLALRNFIYHNWGKVDEKFIDECAQLDDMLNIDNIDENAINDFTS